MLGVRRSAAAAVVVAVLAAWFPAVDVVAAPARPSSPGAPSLPEAVLKAHNLRPGTGVCAGLYEPTDLPASARDKTCTHGPDAPPDTAAGTAASTSGDSPTVAAATRIPCYSTGPYVRVLYIYDSNSLLDAAAPKARRPVIRDIIGIVDQMFAEAAKSTSGFRRVRWRMNAKCKLAITPVKMSTGLSVGAMSYRLREIGKLGSNEKGLAFLERGGGCGGGYAEIRPDDRPGSTNANNRGGMLANVFGCIDAGPDIAGAAQIATHELLHVLGAVQPSAPNATAGYHCVDEVDVMCYDDGTSRPMRKVCPRTTPEVIDCRKNDYFHAKPKAGSYLATRWNSARNVFLARKAPGRWDKLARPKVTFVSPVTGSTVGGTMSIEVNARAPADSSLRSVRFIVGGVLVKDDTSAPFTATIPTAVSQNEGFPNGPVTVKAVAVDTYYRSASAISKVTISNPHVRVVTPGHLAPAAGQTTWSAVATAGPNRTIASVQLFARAEGAQTFVAVGEPDTEAPYGGTWDTSGFADGSRPDFRVKAVDSAGATRWSSIRSVVIALPRARLLWPAPDAWQTPEVWGSTNLVADVDPAWDSSVDRVEFYVDGALVGADSSAPYQSSWTASGADRTVTVTARAFDSLGAPGPLSDPAELDVRSVAASISLNAPSNDSTVSGGSVSLQSTPSVPDDWSIYEVGYMVNGQDVDQSYDAPWSGSWNSTESSNGFAAIVATATVYDPSTGYLKVVSPPRVVTVSNPVPTISLSGPAAGQVVSGAASPLAVSIANVPSGQSVWSVTYYANMGEVAGGWEAPWGSTWNTTSFPDGPVTLRAVATIGWDSEVVSAPVTVTVRNLKVNLRAPAAGEKVSGKIKIAATAAASFGADIEVVRFYVDGKLVGSARYVSYATGRYTVSWNTANVSNGTRTITAKVFTSDGLSRTSAARSVTVAN